MYEKLREPDEKKWHFKKIANLAVISGDYMEKKGLKEILRKAGVAKMKPSEKHLDEKESDFFSMLVEKMGASKDRSLI